MAKIDINDVNIKDLKELFSQHEINISDIDLDEENNSINLYIEVSAIGIYTIDWIESILKKLRIIRDQLIKEGLIDDISLADIYQGIWRILVNFKTE